MDDSPKTNSDQATLWNGTAGHAWVEMQALLDQAFKPLEDLLAGPFAALRAGRVLDVGCGTGSTTLAVAHALAERGRCVGIDISQPMIAAARTRARHEDAAVDFICADAQTYPFEPVGFDNIISRFGVMFFEDPAQAFTNLRRAARAGAAMQTIVWRGPAENPFMTTAERAARPLLPSLPERDAEAPGQFAFADPHRIRRLLGAAGWTEIDIRAVDASCRFPAKDLVRYFTLLGPLGRALHETDERMRARIVATVRDAFDPYVHGDDVRFGAACWIVEARATPF